MTVPHCINCGYCLDGLPQPRCPECGTKFDLDDPSTFITIRPADQHDRVLNRFMIVAVAAVMITAMFIVVCAFLMWFNPTAFGFTSWS